MGIAEGLTAAGLVGGGLAGLSALSSRSQRKAAKSAAAAQEQAAQAANKMEWDMYQQGRKDIEPWREQGARSLAQLAQMTQPGQRIDLSADPGYQFRMQQGQQALERSLARSGMSNSGAALKSAERLGQGMAADEFDRIYNRLAGLANTGQVTAQSLANMGTNYAGQYGQNVGQAANARASAYGAKAQANHNMLSDLIGIAGMTGVFGKK